MILYYSKINKSKIYSFKFSKIIYTGLNSRNNFNKNFRYLIKISYL